MSSLYGDDKLKSQQTYIVNNSNVDEIFNATNNYSFSDYINPGDILDFQGTIDKSHQLLINKPVNIISTTGDGVVNLHTIPDDKVNFIPKNSFIINAGASGSNISDLYINNTQTWIYNAENLYLGNMIMHVSSIAIGEVGQTTIRYCNNVTLNNCYIFSQNNAKEGSPGYRIVFTGTSNSTLINSVVEGQPTTTGRIFLKSSRDEEDVSGEYEIVCTNNTIKNCTLKTSQSVYPIKNDDATHTTIDGLKVYSSYYVQTGAFATLINNNFYNASDVVLGENSVAHDNIWHGSSNAKLETGVTAYNNTFSRVTVSSNGVIIENNTVKGILSLNRPINLKNNNLSAIKLSSRSRNSNITNNNMTGTITVEAANITIKSNFINTTDDYGVIVTAGGAVIEDNSIYAKTKFGDNAISKKDDTRINNNSPPPTFTLLQEIIDKTNPDDEIILGQDYFYDDNIDSSNSGIVISKNLIIIGNGYTIDGMHQSRIFQVTQQSTVAIKQLNFTHGYGIDEIYGSQTVKTGGAISVYMGSNLTIIDSSFIENHADNGWVGAIFITGNSTLNITNSTFADNYALYGNILYVLDGNDVRIFKSNVVVDDIGNDRGEMGLLAPIKILTIPNLIVNISNHVQDSNATVNVTEPDGFTGFADIITDTGQTLSNIQINNSVASANLNLNPGTHNVTLKTHEAEYRKFNGNIAYVYVASNAISNEFRVLKKVYVQINAPNIAYGASETISATIDATGKVTIKLDGQVIKNLTINNKKIEYTIQGILALGPHTVEVMYGGDNYTAPSSSSANFIVYKPDSTLTVNDIVFDYNNTGSTAVSYAGAWGVNVEVINQPKAIVNVKSNMIAVSSLDAGNYFLVVTTIPDEYHNAVTKTVTITVNKINSALSVEDVVLDYGNSTNVSVTIVGAMGVTAKINDEEIIFNGSSIPIPILNAGIYNLTVTTIPDANHNAVSKNATITVNKVNSALNVTDIVLDYGNSTSVSVTTEGALGVTTKINGNEIIFKGDMIPIPVLDAGIYNLTVTTISDVNHNPVTKTATITVNKLNTQLTANEITTTYHVNKNLVITLKDSKGNPLSGVKVNVGLNGAKIT